MTTRWSVVLRAGQNTGPAAQDALARLCQTYWHPLYSFIRHQGRSPADAQDLTQEFFLGLLQRNLVARADPARGRFRSFLLASLKHFLAHEWEKAQARKRGGRVQFLSLDFDLAETRLAGRDTSGTPDRAFERQWAVTLLNVVLDRLQQEYATGGRYELFQAIKETLSQGRANTPYREISVRLGVTESAIKMAAHRLRSRYREILREEIAHTVDDPAEIEAELQFLFAALA